VKVEPDDAEGDWTREGVFEVDPGVYRIPLPLPSDALRAVNVYAIVAPDGVVLIDSGWAIDAARERLEKALATLGCGIPDVRNFLVTHVHRDHYSLAVTLRREYGGRISLGAGEQPNLARIVNPNETSLTAHADLMARCGADKLAAWLRARTSEIREEASGWELPDVWLEQTTLAMAGRTLQVLPTPGHTQGHVVFIDDAADLFFAGDHVLPHITPSIGFEAVVPSLPLADYLRSLRLVRELPDRRLLPAHGPVRPGVHARVDELLEHHARRLDECAAVVATSGRATAHEAAQRLTWTKRRRTYAELDPFNQVLAVIEAAAHLDVLVTQGRLLSEDTDGVRHYTSA
jgi:glyoxylase-like metal-dependent hydrolase (beta-lactamase superfamily II)